MTKNEDLQLQHLSSSDIMSKPLRKTLQMMILNICIDALLITFN